MYGPLFLVLYALVIIATIIFLKIISRFVDNTDKLPSPIIPNEVDPFEIAYLRGKEEEMARSVIFSLIQKKQIEISEDQSTIKRINAEAGANRITKIEQITISWLGNQRSTKEVFGKSGLVKQLESYGMAYKQKLEQQEMLVSSATKWKFTILKWIGIFAIWGIGFYKILAALINGKYNVALILVFGLTGFIVILFLSMPRISKLGSDYLERLQLTFSNLRSTVQNLSSENAAQNTTLAGVDPFLLSVGVFGGGILAGTMYDSYNQAFAKSAQQNAGTFSSCGSDCGSCSSDSGSSCSSSDSGSSCSSCSSCGGCGGCS